MENKKTQGNLGTFGGVFTPSVLTILGIILFLRAGYVVGSGGLATSLIIIAVANVISVLTSVSLAAIATNIKVKNGGDYYLISRTLGLEFGGAIGVVLFFAQAISIAFYCIGFGEALASFHIFAGLGISPRAIAAAAVAFLFILAWMGADWATKFQYIVMVLLVLALASFFVGGFLSWDLATLQANWSAPEEKTSFWFLFALFFPAVTGFTQGVSMSGDLRDPGKSLPMGTFLAVAVSILVYFSVALVFSGVLPNAELAGDYDAMRKIAFWPWLISAGVVAATLSSAMASFLGAPRILQSLAGDKIFPFLTFFAKGAGDSQNPRRAVILAAVIALATIGIGNLNVIAPIVSMFFLISYGLLNYATYFEARSASPSFRPTFTFFHYRLSLVGALACLGVMLAIDPRTGIVAVAILFAIYQYLQRTADPARWADSRRAYTLQKIREYLLKTSLTPEHPRDWRPQILTFSEDKGRRPQLLRLSGWLEGGSGLSTLVTLLEGKDLLLAKKKEETEKELLEVIREQNSAAFPLVLTTEHIENAVHTLLQAHGIGPLRPNTILLNWLDEDAAGIASPANTKFREFLLGRQLKTLFRLGCHIVILHTRADRWDSLMKLSDEHAIIDIWWSDDATGNLMLLFGYLISRSEDWKGVQLRVILANDQEKTQKNQEEMEEILRDVRIEADVVFVQGQNKDVITDISKDSTFILLPFKFYGNTIKTKFSGSPDEILSNLPPAALVLAADDIDLAAEPEEGLAAVQAQAKDVLEKQEKRVQDDEKELAGLEKELQTLEKKLQACSEEKSSEQEEYRQIEQEREEILIQLEKTERRLAKNRSKESQIKKDFEQGAFDEIITGE